VLAQADLVLASLADLDMERLAGLDHP